MGVEVREQSHGWGSHIIEYYSVGTAVVKGAPAADDKPDVPKPTLSLNLNG